MLPSKPHWVQLDQHWMKNKGAYPNNIDKTLSISGGNPQVLEKSEYVLPDRFIVFINQVPVFGFASDFRLADTGKNGTEDPFAENDQCSDNADSFRWNGVSARVTQPG